MNETALLSLVVLLLQIGMVWLVGFVGLKFLRLFAFVALLETSKLWKRAVDTSHPFLMLLAPGCSDRIDFLESVKRIFERMEPHRAFIRPLVFTCFVMKGEVDRKVILLDRTTFDCRDEHSR
jgi:hypothetical protein